MTITKYLAPTVICLAATTVLAATPASADRVAPPTVQVTGADHNIGYEVAVSPDHRAAVATLQSGLFQISGDAVAVTGNDGTLVASIPLSVEIGRSTAEFAASLDQDDRRLTLRPVSESETPVRDLDAQQRFFEVLQAHASAVAAGAGIGAAIGFIAGFPVGLFVLDFITAPLLAVVGGIVGGYIGLQQAGGQTATDTALDYLDSLAPGASDAVRPLTTTLAALSQPTH